MVPEIGDDDVRRLLPFLLLVACGGGSPSGTFDPVVRISLGEPEPGASGATYFDADGTIRIVILPAFADDKATLRHEMAHALMRTSAHMADPSCQCSTPAPLPFIACEAEAAIVRLKNPTPMVFSFPENPDALVDAAFWWSWSCGGNYAKTEAP